MRKLTVALGLVVVMALGLVAIGERQPAQAATGDNLVLAWNEETLDAIRSLSPGPTVAVRALAVVHTAIYDAWAAYDAVAVGTRLGANLRRPTAERTQANKERAVSFAAYLALVACSRPARPSSPSGWPPLGTLPMAPTSPPRPPSGPPRPRRWWTFGTATGPTS